jgi:hypothetical protein
MTHSPDTAAKARRHLEHSSKYFENCREALDKDEVSKAGELLWGSVSQVFHALATVRGVDVQRHRRLKNFAIHVSDETEDPQKRSGDSCRRRSCTRVSMMSMWNEPILRQASRSLGIQLTP